MRDPGSGAFLTPGSRIRNRFFPDLGSQTHIVESLATIFGQEVLEFFENWPKFFSFAFQKLNNLQFWEIYGCIKGLTTNFFSHLSFDAVLDPGSEIQDPGSGMGKNQDPGSRINILDPRHCS